jgi:flavodoxin
MKTLIVYTSIAHGNTEKVAQVMAEVLGADLAKTQETKPERLAGYDLIGFGSGTTMANMTKLFSNLSRRCQQHPARKFSYFLPAVLAPPISTKNLLTTW